MPLFCQDRCRPVVEKHVEGAEAALVQVVRIPLLFLFSSCFSPLMVRTPSANLTSMSLSSMPGDSGRDLVALFGLGEMNSQASEPGRYAVGCRTTNNWRGCRPSTATKRIEQAVDFARRLSNGRHVSSGAADAFSVFTGSLLASAMTLAPIKSKHSRYLTPCLIPPC